MPTVLRVLCVTALISQLSCGDVKPQKELYLPDYRYYHNVSRIISHLQEIAHQHPSYVHLDMSYHSRNGNPQPVVRITNFTSMRFGHAPFQNIWSNRAVLLLSYGEHAREFLPIESMFFLIRNLTDGLLNNTDYYAKKFSRYIVSNMDIFIVAIVNPDGRELVETTQNFCWRGTSTGVDLNRNFDWNYGFKGSSKNKDDEEFRGSGPFSEPECQVLLELTSQYQFDCFVSFHSGIRQIYVPFADTLSKEKNLKPKNFDQMMELGKQMAAAASMRKPFSYGVAYNINDYTADGTIFDYMAGNRKIPFCYAIELWGSGNSQRAKCFDLFNPKSQHIKFAVMEHFPIYETLLQYLISYKQRLYTTIGGRMEDPSNPPSSTRFVYLLLVTPVLIVLLAIFYSHAKPWLKQYRRRRIVSLKSLSSSFTMNSFIKVS